MGGCAGTGHGVDSGAMESRHGVGGDDVGRRDAGGTRCGNRNADAGKGASCRWPHRPGVARLNGSERGSGKG